MTHLNSKLLVAALAAALATPALAAGEATFDTRSLTPETALKAAQAALKTCQKAEYNVAVAVADRAGVTQVLIRDRFAGAHTPQTAMGMAWTAASFRTNTSELDAMAYPDDPSYGIRYLPGAVIMGGGMPIESRGVLVGAIGVSGAPTAPENERCAKTGIEAIRESLEL